VRTFLKVGLCALMLALAAQAGSAQDGQRLRQWQARRQVAQQHRMNPGPNANGHPNNQPNARGMMGLPGPWIQKLRDMPPDEQERFMQNNQRFQGLPPQQQAQIRRNLDRWNQLSPEEKQAARDRETALERMSPEQRDYVRNTLLPKWQAMPQDRRQAINRHLAMLRNMSPATQQAALNDPRFMQGLNPDEQSMLRDLNSLRNPAPAAQATPQ